MFETFRWHTRRRLTAAAGAAALAAGLAAVVLPVLVGCTSGSGVTDTAEVVPVSSSSSIRVSDARTPSVALRFDDHTAAATLTDTPAARDFAANLPATLVLRDTWGQAKTGQLPRPIQVAGTDPVTKPLPGGIYYWPDTATLAVYYDDLGQSVPPPGLIRLGTVDTGVVDEIAEAGGLFTVRIDEPIT